MVLGYVNVKREIAAINKGRIESVSGRMPIWKGTLDMIRTYPLLGAGPGTFPLLCEDYIGKYVSNLRDKYAHSEYLQTGAEWGGFSLLIIFWIQILFFLAAFRAYAQAHTRFSQYLRLGILGSITAISIHSLAEFALHPMANAILCVVLGALAINSHNR
jgi:O-antigen ligase